MTRRPQIWPWLKPFVILMLVVTIPPLTYWFVYVKHTVDAAMQQAHTTLSAVATNFKDRLAAHDQIAVTTGYRRESTKDDLRSVKEQLQSVLQLRELTVVATQAQLAVSAESGGLHLHVGKFPPDGAACNFPSGCSLRAVVALENLIPWQIVQPEFDGLLVLSDDGRLLAQDRRLPTQALGIRMSVREGTAQFDYATLFGEPKSKGAATDTPQRIGSLFDFTTERSIQVAGVDYVVFLQPVTVAVTRLDNDQVNGNHISFLVCGLLRKDRLRSEAIKLSPQTLTLTGALVALGLFAIPFLKLRFIGARERMRSRDLWLLCASLLCVTALVTVLMLDAHTRDKLHDRFDNSLRQFTLSITENLAAESTAALTQLRSSATDILRSVQTTEPRANPLQNCSAPNSVGSILTDNNGSATGAFSYPDFEAIYITDRCGNQWHKWMPRTTPTPNVSSAMQPFYVATFALQDQSFAFSSLIARASGLQLGVYTQPLDLNTREFGPQVKFADRTGIVAIATPLRSANAPVVPQPFQFVLVNRQGEVTFQQAQGPFRGERFFEVVDNGQVLERIALDNASLERAARAVNSSIVSRDYRGRAYRMNAVDIPELQQTLIAYYDEATIDSLAARIFGTAAVFTALVIACILTGAALAACWFGAHSHDWLWPTASRSAMYFVGALLCVAIMIVVGLVRALVGSGLMAALFMLTPIIVMAALGSGYVTRWLEWLVNHIPLPEALSTKRWRTSRAYQIFGVTGLIALIAWPTALIVDDAFTMHTAAYNHNVVNEWQLAQEKSRRAFAASVINVGTTLPPMECRTNPDQRCVLPERTYTTQTNYDNLLATRNSFGVYRNCADLQRNRDSNTARHCTADAVPWSFTASIANQLARFSSKPDLALVIAGFADGQRGLSAAPLTAGFVWSKWTLVGFFFLVGMLCLLVGSVAKHVLGVGLTNRLALDESNEFAPAPQTQWLLLRPTASTLAVSIKAASTLFDLRDATLKPAFTPPGKDETVVIHHIESRIAQIEWRNALLLLLCSPADGCVVLSSEIDPLHYLMNRVLEAEETASIADDTARPELQKISEELRAELTEWSSALRRVRKIRSIIKLPPTPALHIRTTNAARLAAECACTEPLVEIGARLAKVDNIETYRWDEVLGFVMDAAEPYYRSLWALCSREEKLVLIQLAQEGLVNPKRIEIVQRLARRSLVSVDPRFKLMNESFCRFVRTIETRERIAEWERTPSHSAWSRLGAPLYALAAVIIAILLFTEQEMFTSIVAVATGAAGTLGSMRNLYTSTVKPVVDIAKNV